MLIDREKVKEFINKLLCGDCPEFNRCPNWVKKRKDCLDLIIKSLSIKTLPDKFKISYICPPEIKFFLDNPEKISTKKNVPNWLEPGKMVMGIKNNENNIWCPAVYWNTRYNVFLCEDYSYTIIAPFDSKWIGYKLSQTGNHPQQITDQEIKDYDFPDYEKWEK
jgi:hypothetical protein